MNIRRFVWVVALCLGTVVIASTEAADEPTVWKYDGGSFEKQANGTWVQKEGGRTFPLEEKFNKKGVVMLFDKARKLSFELRDKSAKVVGGPKLKILAGEWTTAEAKGPGPKADDKRTVWTYDKGSFEKRPDGTWVQKEGGKTYEYAEKQNFPDNIELFDATRKTSVRLMAGTAVVTKLGVKEPLQRLKGDWAASAVVKGKDAPPAKIGRTAWKYDNGYFVKVDNRTWLHKSGKNTVEYEEMGAKVGYVEIRNPKTGDRVKLMRDAATYEIGGKLQRDQLKGEWVDPATLPKEVVVKPVPLDGKSVKGHFVEVANVKRKGPPGSYNIVPSPDAKRLALMQDGGNYVVIDVESGKVEHSWKPLHYVHVAEWSADGKTLVGTTAGSNTMTGKSESKVYVWDATTGEEKAAYDFDGLPFALAVSPDCNIVAAAGPARETGGLLKVWDVKANKEVLSQKAGGTDVRLSMTDNGKVLAINGGGNDMIPGMLSFIDLPSGKPRGTMKSRPKFLMSGDGNTVVEWGNSNDRTLTVNVWNTKAVARGARTIRIEKWTADTVAFLNNDQHLAVAGGSTRDEVKIFDLKTMTEYDSFTVGPPPPPRIARKYLYIRPSLDSSRLLAYGGDYVLRMWSTPFGPKDPAPMPQDKK